jgi:hypothetical protein
MDCTKAIFIGAASPTMTPAAQRGTHRHGGTAVTNRTGLSAAAARLPTVRVTH